MSEMKEKYPWWDWSFFIQMQLDWLKEASEKHKEEGHLQNHVEVSGELEAAYMFLREAKEAFDGLPSDEGRNRAKKKMKKAYEYIINHIDNWWD